MYSAEREMFDLDLLFRVKEIKLGIMVFGLDIAFQLLYLKVHFMLYGF